MLYIIPIRKLIIKSIGLLAGSLPTNDCSLHRMICFNWIMKYLMQNTKPLGKQLPKKSDNHKNRMLKYIEDSANLLT